MDSTALFNDGTRRDEEEVASWRESGTKAEDDELSSDDNAITEDDTGEGIVKELSLDGTALGKEEKVRDKGAGTTIAEEDEEKF